MRMLSGAARGEEAAPLTGWEDTPVSRYASMLWVLRKSARGACTKFRAKCRRHDFKGIFQLAA